MDSPTGPIQIPLTPEQQQVLGRVSGQFPQMLEVTPEAGSGFRFSWRLSTATDGPQQQPESAGPVAEPPAEPLG
jgi:hypothetical protein